MSIENQHKDFHGREPTVHIMLYQVSQTRSCRGLVLPDLQPHLADTILSMKMIKELKSLEIDKLAGNNIGTCHETYPVTASVYD